MAIFGTKKGEKTSKPKAEKKAKKAEGSRVSRARRTTLAHGANHTVIGAPWFSEKALLATERGVYAFAVPSRASKAEIAGAIKEIYNVEPRAIRIVNLPGKRKMLRTRRGFGTRAARRKAYIYLAKGETIQFS
jgi:large subunit ribosomal protein L23